MRAEAPERPQQADPGTQRTWTCTISLIISEPWDLRGRGQPTRLNDAAAVEGGRARRGWRVHKRAHLCQPLRRSFQGAKSVGAGAGCQPLLLLPTQTGKRYNRYRTAFKRQPISRPPVLRAGHTFVACFFLKGRHVASSPPEALRAMPLCSETTLRSSACSIAPTLATSNLNRPIY